MAGVCGELSRNLAPAPKRGRGRRRKPGRRRGGSARARARGLIGLVVRGDRPTDRDVGRKLRKATGNGRDRPAEKHQAPEETTTTTATRVCKRTPVALSVELGSASPANRGREFRNGRLIFPTALARDWPTRASF